MNKKICSSILTAAMLLANTGNVFAFQKPESNAIVSRSTSATVVEEGECGKNVTYKLYDDGRLIISGSGNTYNYYHGEGDTPESPFTFKENIKNVVVEEGITNIGQGLFYSCGGESLEVTLPVGLKTIEDGAFMISNLVNIVIPDSVTKIGNEAFSCCGALKTIKLSNNLTSIGYYAFDSCLLPSIELPDSLKTIDFGAFQNSELKALNIPKNVNKIGRDLFYGCSKISTLTVSKDNKTFSATKGMLCDKKQTKIIQALPTLKTVSIPKTINRIGKYAFFSGEVSSITIPSNVKVIEQGAFEDTDLKKLTFKNGVKEIGNFAFSRTALKEVIIPKSITKMGDTVFQENEDGRGITLKVYANSYGLKYAKKYKGIYKYEIIDKIDIAKAKFTKVSNKTYTGKQIKPTVTVKYGKKTLKKNTDYTISYGKNKATGKATIKIVGKGKYTESKTITFYIVPKKVTLSSVKAGKKQAIVKYKKVTGASGYQIAYSTSKTKGFKYVNVNSKNASAVIKKLTSKKTYYFKVRAYKTVEKTKKYGSYSTIKSCKVK